MNLSELMVMAEANPVRTTIILLFGLTIVVSLFWAVWNHDVQTKNEEKDSKSKAKYAEIHGKQE